MGGTILRSLLRLAGNPGLHPRVRDPRLTALVPRIESVQAFLFESLLPAGDCRCSRVQRCHDLAIGLTIRQSPDEPGSQYVTCRQGPRRGPPVQLAPLFVGQLQHRVIPSHAASGATQWTGCACRRSRRSHSLRPGEMGAAPVLPRDGATTRSASGARPISTSPLPTGGDGTGQTRRWFDSQYSTGGHACLN